MPSQAARAECERPTVFDLDDEMMNTVRGMPERLIREDECPPEVAALGPLRPPLPSMPPNSTYIGGWFPTESPESPPQVVVAGICQGRGSIEEKQLWLDSGPTVEVVCQLDAAARLAESYPGCEFQISIVDQEYANIVSDSTKFTSRPEIELRLGAELQRWCCARYPTATVKRTGEAEGRARLYSIAAGGALAKLYPEGVPQPYGNKGRVFWQEVQYLVSVAAFVDPVLTDGRRTLAIADHEQLRALAAAKQMAGDGMSALAVWPCPRLGWKAPRRKRDESSNRYAERLLFALKNDNRRMYRGSALTEQLFQGFSEEQVAERMNAIDVCPSTVDEIHTFVTGERVPVSATMLDVARSIADALRRFRDSRDPRNCS